MTLTMILVIMTGLISYQAFNNVGMKQKLWFHPVSIKNSGEYYRFITHGFVHADFGHLLINMYVLYVFGESIEKYFTNTAIFGPVMGRVLFITLYMGAIILSSIPSYFKHKENNFYAAVGASGATSAIVFAFIIFDPWGWFIFPPLPGVLMAIAYLWYSSYMSKKGTDNIGHDAHFWGSIFGLIFTLFNLYYFVPNILKVIIARLLEGPSAPF